MKYKGKLIYDISYVLLKKIEIIEKILSPIV